MTVWNPKRAQEQGIDVAQVVESYGHHMLKGRQRVRDNPRQLAVNAPPASYALTVAQTSTASGVGWKTLGTIDGVDAVNVAATSMDAARNKITLRQLLEQRYRAAFATALQRAGLYQADLEGRRAAMAVAIASPITVADVGDLGVA
jgi:hypothetical protein